MPHTIQTMTATHYYQDIMYSGALRQCSKVLPNLIFDAYSASINA